MSDVTLYLTDHDAVVLLMVVRAFTRPGYVVPNKVEIVQTMTEMELKLGEKLQRRGIGT